MGNHQLFCFLALQAVPGLHMYFSARKVPKAALIAMQCTHAQMYAAR